MEGKEGGKKVRNHGKNGITKKERKQGRKEEEMR